MGSVKNAKIDSDNPETHSETTKRKDTLTKDLNEHPFRSDRSIRNKLERGNTSYLTFSGYFLGQRAGGVALVPRSFIVRTILELTISRGRVTSSITNQTASSWKH